MENNKFKNFWENSNKNDVNKLFPINDGEDRGDKVVKICWRQLNNSCLNDIVKDKPNIDMENHSEAMKVVNDSLQYEAYYRNFANVLFGKYDPNTISINETDFDEIQKNLVDGIKTVNKQGKIVRDGNTRLIDKDADTFVFTPNEKEKHKALAKAFCKAKGVGMYNDECLGNPGYEYLVKIVNSNEMNNKSCEFECVDASKKARKYNQKMIFISTMMAIRSFSNKYIKNIIFLMNGMCDDTLAQRIARAFTYWCTEHNIAYIVDFRLTEYSSNFSLASLYLNSDFYDTHKVQKIEDVREYSYKYIKSNPTHNFLIYKILVGRNFNDIFVEINDDEFINNAITKKSDVTMQHYRNIFSFNNVRSGDCTKVYKDPTTGKLVNINNIGESSKIIKDHIKQNTNQEIENEEKNKKKQENNELKIKQIHLEFLLMYGGHFNSINCKENCAKQILDSYDVDNGYGCMSNYIQEFGYDKDIIKDILIEMTKNPLMTDKFFLK